MDSLEHLDREGQLGHRETEAYKDLLEVMGPKVLREIVDFTASKETLDLKVREEKLA
jgi:hypothetical protein